jgi:hypothetical protein
MLDFPDLYRIGQKLKPRKIGKAFPKDTVITGK